MATFRANFPEAFGSCGDLRDSELRAGLLELARGVDVVAGGPPCQGFSQVRNHARLIDDPKNALYSEFVNVVGSLSPKAFIMENVPGMAQMGVVGQVLDDLGCGGRYDVLALPVDAVDFGVPQSRKRIIFLGLHRDLGVTQTPIYGSGFSSAVSLSRIEDGRPRYEIAGDSSLSSGSPTEILVDPWNELAVTVEQAIGDLAFLRSGTNKVDAMPSMALPEPTSGYQKAMRRDLDETLTNIGVPRINEDTQIRLRQIPPGGNYLDLPDALRSRYLTGKKWGQHNGSDRLSRTHYYAYRRLHPDIWSWTLNTKADSVYHWSRARCLSVREFARLQSFPDSFRFVTDPRRGRLPGRIDGGPGHSRYRQVGNAVPPLLARSLAQHLLSLLGR
jgi:DNA (cytosine-5)-methyltransferase 1